MPRNIAKPLDYHETKRQRFVARVCEQAQAAEKDISLDYTKRNGEAGSVTGKVVFFNGVEGMDTYSVTVEDNEKGNRTINLHRVTVIK